VAASVCQSDATCTWLGLHPGQPLHDCFPKLPIFIELSPVYAGSAMPTTASSRAKALSRLDHAVFDADGFSALSLYSEKGISLVLAYAPPGGKLAVLARVGYSQSGSTPRPLRSRRTRDGSCHANVNQRGSGPSPPYKVGGPFWRLGSDGIALHLVETAHPLSSLCTRAGRKAHRRTTTSGPSRLASLVCPTATSSTRGRNSSFQGRKAGGGCPVFCPSS